MSKGEILEKQKEREEATREGLEILASIISREVREDES